MHSLDKKDNYALDELSLQVQIFSKELIEAGDESLLELAEGAEPDEIEEEPKSKEGHKEKKAEKKSKNGKKGE